MTILDYGDLLINGTVIAYEGAVKVKPGAKKRTVHPQVNGQKIVTTDIAENMSMITVNILVTPESNTQFDGFYNNGDNNTITFRDQNFTACIMEEPPEREDLATVDYVFMGDPAI
jgi:hypothetical protein